MPSPPMFQVSWSLACGASPSSPVERGSAWGLHSVLILTTTETWTGRYARLDPAPPDGHLIQAPSLRNVFHSSSHTHIVCPLQDLGHEIVRRVAPDMSEELAKSRKKHVDLRSIDLRISRLERLLVAKLGPVPEAEGGGEMQHPSDPKAMC